MIASVSQQPGSLVEEALDRLHEYIRTYDYAGFDPYDGLESRVFRATPFNRFKWTRLAWIQLIKRCPLNLRPWLAVPRSRNSKGVGLCASALIQLAQAKDETPYKEEARALLDWLEEHRIRTWIGSAWGYNFDWQSRFFYAPKGMPNAICTIFVANAFLDAFESLKRESDLYMASGATEFLMRELMVSKDTQTSIRYVPNVETEVHNVNLLGAALLARVYGHTAEDHLRERARRAVAFSLDRQKPDGSWPYGENPKQNWVDNFHTGFNLVALSQYLRCTADNDVEDSLQRGYEFWDQNFFLSDGTPKYYHDQLYPIDIHCAAQGIVTYLEFCDRDPRAMVKAFKLAQWAIENMQSPEGWFYYQKKPYCTVRIPFMRWSQAWMFYALSSLLKSLSYRDEV